MITDRDEDAPGNSRPRWLLGVAGVMAAACAVVWWPGCRQYPAVSSRESLQMMKLLYTACNTKDPTRLEKVEQGLTPVCGRCKARIPIDVKPVTVTDATFSDQVERSPVPVLLDLWAPWCGPCRMIAPVLESLASEWAGRVRVAKLNVDENPATAARRPRSERRASRPCRARRCPWSDRSGRARRAGRSTSSRARGRCRPTAGTPRRTARPATARCRFAPAPAWPRSARGPSCPESRRRPACSRRKSACR